MLLQSGNFRLKGKKALLNQAEIPVITVMDVTETPIESPQKKQKENRFEQILVSETNQMGVFAIVFRSSLL